MWPFDNQAPCQTEEFTKFSRGGAGEVQDPEELCNYLVSKFALLPPHDAKMYKDWSETSWGTSPQCARDLFAQVNCAGVLHLYEALLVTDRSELPEFVLEPVMTAANMTILGDITDVVLKRFAETNAEHVALFGTLLGLVRPGKGMMPWDDDIDLGINTDSVAQFLAGLPEEDVLPTTPYNALPWQQAHPAKMYRLSSKPHVSVLVKEWGVPLKVFMNNQKHPFLDVYTYGRVAEMPDCLKNPKQKHCNPTNNDVGIPSVQLKRGHIFKFAHAHNDFYPLKRSVFAMPDGRSVILNCVNKYKAVLEKDYGEGAIETCITTHTHVNAAVTSYKFPCSLVLKPPASPAEKALNDMVKDLQEEEDEE